MLIITFSASHHAAEPCHQCCLQLWSWSRFNMLSRYPCSSPSKHRQLVLQSRRSPFKLAGRSSWFWEICNSPHFGRTVGPFWASCRYLLLLPKLRRSEQDCSVGLHSCLPPHLLFTQSYTTNRERADRGCESPEPTNWSPISETNSWSCHCSSQTISPLNDHNWCTGWMWGSRIHSSAHQIHYPYWLLQISHQYYLHEQERRAHPQCLWVLLTQSHDIPDITLQHRFQCTLGYQTFLAVTI